MKKYISGLLTGIIIATSFTVFAAVQLKVIPNPYPVLVNGTKANVQGYNINGSTYLKLSDLKVAGLDAKFDKKQITINKTSAELDATKQTSDLLKIYTFENIDYVSLREVCAKYNKFTFGRAEGTSSTEKIMAFMNKSDNKELLYNLEYKVYGGSTYVTKDYYMSTLLPIIRAEGY